MKKAIGAILASVIMAMGIAPSAAYADERGRRHYERNHDRHHRDYRGDDALAAGVVGLALGAILGSALSERRDQDPYREGYYRDGYYGDRYDRRGYYDRPPATCIRRERRYDPYYDRVVVVERRFRC